MRDRLHSIGWLALYGMDRRWRRGLEYRIGPCRCGRLLGREREERVYAGFDPLGSAASCNLNLSSLCNAPIAYHGVDSLLPLGCGSSLERH